MFSSLVNEWGISSTRSIKRTGLKKWIPMKRSCHWAGKFSAISAMEMFEVLVPTIVSSLQLLKMYSIVLRLTERVSATASITRSQSLRKPASFSISAQKRDDLMRFASVPFISPFFRIVSMALEARTLPDSSPLPLTTSTTSSPALAPQAAMAAPIVPAPTTAIFKIVLPMRAPFLLHLEGFM